MKSWLLIFFLVACNSVEPEESTLKKSWGLDQGFGCSLSLNFEDDGTYQLMRFCAFDTFDGAYLEEGEFSIQGAQLTLTLNAATCEPSGEITTKLEYNLEGERLVIISSDGALVFEPRDAPEISQGAITFGCFQNNVFTQHSLVSWRK